MKKKTPVWTIIGALLLIILILWLTVFGGWNRLKGSGGSDDKVANTVIDPKNAVIETANDKAIYWLGYEEGYKAGKEECADSLQALRDIRYVLSCVCQEKTTAVVKTTSPARPRQTATATPDNSVKRPANTFAPPPDNRQQTTSSSENRSDLSLSNVLYEPIYLGDMGLTLISNGEGDYHPVYYIANQISDQHNFQTAVCSAGSDKGDNSPMALSGDYLVYVDYTVKLNSKMIENDYWRFSIYIGEFSDNGSSYPMYYPHEGVKPLLKQYLGRESGEITASDLAVLAPYNAGIANGYIRPNGYYSQPDASGKIYGGWEIFSKMNHKKTILQTQ